MERQGSPYFRYTIIIMKAICTLVFLCLVNIVYSQQLPIVFKSSETILVEKTISDGLFLLRQEYQLEDTLTHKRYTLDNRSDFGSVVSFGVLTESGYIVRNDIVTPWEKDRQFEQYRDSQYRPVLSRTMIRTANDSTWRESALISPQCVCPMKDSQWVEVKDSLYATGLVSDYSDGKKDGWTVWLTSGKEHKDSSALSLVTYRQSLELSGKGDDDLEIKVPNTNTYVLGGIYINPCFDRIGQVTFKVCGIIIKKEDSWALLRCISWHSAEESNAEKTDEDKAPMLTPLESGPEPDENGDQNPEEVKKEKQNKKRKK